MKQGFVLGDVVLAGSVSILIFALVASQLTVFWQCWQQVNNGLHQRQWATDVFDYLQRDMEQSREVSLGDSLRLLTEDGWVTYRLSAAGSFYRRQGNTYYALAYEVETARWQTVRQVLWLELEFAGGIIYRTCFRLPEEEQ